MNYVMEMAKLEENVFVAIPPPNTGLNTKCHHIHVLKNAITFNDTHIFVRRSSMIVIRTSECRAISVVCPTKCG
jgi:hypothetical protein